eukprot:Plantae.Rhodophyta-Purpureofilum_apyrenoidigerum.ctg24419.p1 GENE.Plantae.Rhodophyta-Purpureofilum_apyrenoidigerum.ctg24419~~Plantae.Rhodophyta-Purpureofilum_apyrenoidigerum.ctg24419.p1  ORF type:complete len:335 (-),score=69.30 Plantae.Rhodophyta-Purpureofilum_apyrenoidigerum.ctg24419:67-1023(-)
MSMLGRFGSGSLLRTAAQNGSLWAGRGDLVVVPHREMANLKAVRNRMRSVGSISKITKAMKMVAAAKLRGVQSKQQLARPFSDSMDEFFKTLNNPERSDKQSTAKKALVIALTSDRGLCGGVNSSVVKDVRAYIGGSSSENEEKAILLLGDKGRDALSRTLGSSIIISFKDVFKNLPTFPQVCVITEEILAREFDIVTIVYNQFRSVISQEVSRRNVYGLEYLQNNASLFDEYEFDTDLDGAMAFRDLFEFQIATQLYSAMLDNSTSEQAARMSAMDNATNNAKDMLGRLTITYNRQRQAVITSELIEIISGAEALKG